MEGLALLVLAALAYSRFGQSWALFAVLFLAPDLSFAGYLAGPRAGAWAYNLAHSLIWLAHIGFDRALGYGLKSPEAFGLTHLGLIGPARRAAQVDQ
ncbi:MAG: DUF4260 family protein [Brevundimonas diminuta]|uniref:DUF4260 family protein n=1 Tax=Brevundimonas diminuta TaxID=293 RepID=UPI000EDD0CE1|nr:DUF4260 family protein [Brevundimonas diminuta]MBI2250115.1 DUF4260 family protein [Brevundimonas diminuta]HCQ54072.1 DUF4260 domain-containing protein [Brevundimonas diminuta]